MTIAHPITRAWLSAGAPAGHAGHATGAQNYDEFADDAEITAILAENPNSALGVEMPHRAPESVGRPFRDCLPDAVRRLADAKSSGRYASAGDVAVLYRITGTDGATAYGLWCMIDTDQISTAADEPGIVIRNEDVFLDKVRERVALAEATGHLLSPVLLLQTATGEELQEAIIAAIGGAGAPAATDIDQTGRAHEIWPLGPGSTRDALLGLAGGGELVVADGNHRTLAAQTAGLPRFLAVVTTPASVTIEPYNRLVSEMGIGTPELCARLNSAGSDVEPLRDPVELPPHGGVVHVYTADGSWAVTPAPDLAAGVIDNLDHALVERRLLGDALGLEPGDKRITYVGGDYPASWLRGEVDAGRAELAILIAPVTVDDFVAVNLAREKMPRKSTWFTPKARAGLVVAELAEEA